MFKTVYVVATDRGNIALQSIMNTDGVMVKK